jgi:phospholipid/cholesterol/gamma-HCH transport system substrate-binding protein
VVVADLLQRSRPLVKSDVAKLRQLAALLNQPESRKIVVETLDRLPESMTDQTRTGTYGSWYSYYLCEYSGKIELPELEGIPGIAQLTKELSSIRFHSTAPRCQS